MKKRVILPLLLTIAMLFSNHSIARAQQPIKLWINGSYVQTDTSPLIQNNRTLVPLRVISENLGLQVEWDAETKSVMTYKLIDGRPDFKESLLLTIGDKQVPKPAEEAADTGSLYYELEAPPVIINNRTMVPIRFIAEAYKMPVDWDGANRTVIVGKGYTAPKAKPQAKKPVPQPKKNVPKEYKVALKKANDYLSFMPFSKQGLFDQLTSEYGEKFPADAAQYAVDNVKTDWNKNALRAAITYRNEMHMSRAGIYDQLISEYGDRYTASEAQFAVDHLPD